MIITRKYPATFVATIPTFIVDFLYSVGMDGCGQLQIDRANPDADEGFKHSVRLRNRRIVYEEGSKEDAETFALALAYAAGVAADPDRKSVV